MTAENVEIRTTAPVAPTTGHGCGCGGAADEGDPVLDVHALPRPIRHAAVLGAFDAIAPGAALVLVAPHLPHRLLAQIAERAQIETEVLVDGPDAWHVKVTRVA